jgi:pyrroline-5-carboxylate reductase
MRKSLGFIGGSKSTSMLLRGFMNRDVKFKRIVVADSNPIVFEGLKSDFPDIRADSVAVAAGQDIVFLALEQSLLMDTLALINNEFRENTIVVSLVRNINIAKLSLRLGKISRIARVLPSPATYINEAYTPVSFSPGFPANDKDTVMKLFGHLGRVVEVPEDKLETYSIMSAILPAYFWYQWKELVNMGREIGLSEEETIDFISESVSSSLHMNYRAGLSEDQVVDLMPVSPIQENDSEVREAYRRRLIDLYRRYKPELMESTSTRLG